jgi:hypothetical protein
MNKIRLVLLSLCVLLFFLIIGSSVVLHNPEMSPMAMQPKVESIEKIRVIAGNEFDIWTVNGERIHGFLEVNTPDGTGSEVAGAVQKLLNQCENPIVKLLRKDGEAWKVEIYLKVSGQDVILSDYLKQNSMIWK